MTNKKGFTLMEILAVLLVIAVVVSMAVPVLRSVRYEVKNSQAKTAAHKLAQAVRAYYQVSRGGVPKGQSFTPTVDADKNNVVLAAASDCVAPSETGIPLQKTTGTVEIKQLFACGYLSFKDFISLPYTFTVCDPRPGQVPNETCRLTEATGTNTPIVVVKGADGSGDKYDVSKNSAYHIYVDQSMKAKDSSK
ncbi:prepilin-type N-terminal cleavage/methylation domain-containing protein [Candidatus Avelusimicrobium stercoris]|uniref:prepilin-type N-terminal cleavage/methylation domain-containing protein n=1 Tax=Candidatus Avelusimicrobium stercoris TaxID=1947924 RepID=UPI000EBD40AF|nr:hypothetical protein [Elusimicrobiota bacterium]